MTEQEYKMLQKRLTNKLCHSPYGPASSSKYKEGYREGILAAKSVLHGFYQEFGEDAKETAK